MISGELWTGGALSATFLYSAGHDQKAAKKFFRKVLKGFTDVPRVIITDKLRRYGEAKREILTNVEHRQHCLPQ
jgi:putative transposase